MKENEKNKNPTIYKIPRGRIFLLEDSTKSKIRGSELALVVSNEMHNQFSDYLIVALVSDKGVEKIRESLEVYCELETGKGAEKKRIKIFASYLYTVSKIAFLEREKYIGKVDNITMKKVAEIIKNVLGLDL